MILRPYQLEAIEEIRQHLRNGKRRILLVAPTGSGKTVIAAEMIRLADEKGGRKIFMCHRRELVEQCASKLDLCGVKFGVIRADDKRRKPWLTTHICSVPTLVRRSTVPPADIIFIDEAHRAGASSYKQIVERYPGAAVIGLTATPIRDGGRGLGDLFEEMVQCPQMQELTDMGFLVPARCFSPSRPDLTGVAIERGDYQNAALAAIMDRPALTGDVVEHYKKLCPDRLAVCFAVNVAHSQHIVEQFRAAGISAEHLDGECPNAERDAILKRLHNGQTRVVSNCAVLTEGWDEPAVDAVLLCRPTQSLGLWLQMVGRCLRPFPGKHDAIVLDHSGACLEFGLPSDTRDWVLDSGRRKKKAKDDDVTPVTVCMRCYFTFDRRKNPVCPGRDPVTNEICGWAPYVQARKIEQVDGELQEIQRGQRSVECFERVHHVPKFRDLVRWNAERLEKSYKPGYPMVMFRQRHHGYPPREWSDAALHACTAKPKYVAEIMAEYRDSRTAKRNLLELVT